MTGADILMTDTFGRRITDVRIALNSACNLRCIYCHREGEDINEGCVRKEAGSELSRDEIVEVVSLLQSLGVRTLKLTGGEPTLRRDLVELIAALPKDGLEISMTTNGTRLKELAVPLKEAGLARVNISIDSLKPERYAKITGKNLLPQVLEGLEAARAAGLTPVKINTVLLPGINDDEVEDFLSFVRGRDDLILQFIELMDLNGWTDGADTSVHENHRFAAELEERFKREAAQVTTRRMHHRHKYNLNGATVEIVRPMHNAEFCANCNRLRITSDGLLKPCLLRCGNEVSMKGLHGEALRDAVRQAVHNRAPYFRGENK
ncbi:MAG TPA: GTP 3',8-cyclase MoaA [Methanocorpusculum sp.]|nr:GTP 3',8-cyclase MoaA [Methanocorpusculum sp.]